MYLGLKIIGLVMAGTEFFKKIEAFPAKFLYRAPRAFVLKITRNSDARFTKLIAGKRVAIVGNAKSLLSTEFGAEIDAHDVVIRLNKGFPKQHESQGHRTDAVGLTPELSEDEVTSGFKPKVFLFLIPRLRHYNLYRKENVARTIFNPFRAWLSDRNLIGRRPSSGFMAISFVLRANAATELNLYGFDFGATATYYNPNGYVTPHDFAKEAEIVRAWENDGRLTIVKPV